MQQDHTPTERLQAWEHTRNGQFALEQEKKFLLQMTSEWRRRMRSLLVIECGTGIFLETFWEAGFDVSGTASCAADLHKARTRIGRRADLHLSSPHDLRFDDKAFDYVLLITVLDYCRHPHQVLKEASRVCGKQLLISFLNKYSMYALSLRAGRGRRPPQPLRWWSRLEMNTFLSKTVRHARICSQGGILPGPQATWNPSSVGRMINSWCLPNTFGAYCALCLDMTNDPIHTPLMAWAQGPKPSAPCSQRMHTHLPTRIQAPGLEKLRTSLFV